MRLPIKNIRNNNTSAENSLGFICGSINEVNDFKNMKIIENITP